MILHHVIGERKLLHEIHAGTFSHFSQGIYSIQCVDYYNRKNIHRGNVKQEIEHLRCSKQLEFHFDCGRGITNCNTQQLKSVEYTIYLLLQVRITRKTCVAIVLRIFRKLMEYYPNNCLQCELLETQIIPEVDLIDTRYVTKRKTQCNNTYRRLKGSWGTYIIYSVLR